MQNENNYRERARSTAAFSNRKNVDVYPRTTRYEPQPRQNHATETLHEVDQEYRPSQQEYTHDQDRPYQDLSHSRYTRDSEHVGGGGLRNAFEYGEHTGKGPKGYTRSEERIREDVCEVLTQDGSIDASEIEVAVSQGIVTLSGTVDSRLTKRRAEEAIERLSGVQDIKNELRVAGISK